MITTFPDFTPVTLSSLPDVLELTLGYEHYADFSPVLLWCWNRGYPGGLSQLDGNLIIKVRDPMAGEPFLTFVPRHAVRQTVVTLLEYANHHQLSPCLRAIPARRQDLLPADDAFEVCDDRDYFEYLLSVDDWVDMRGHEFRNKRHAIHRLERRWPLSSDVLSLEDNDVQENMIHLCHLWATQRGVSHEEAQPELTAIRNLFDYRPLSHLFVLGAYVRDSLVGFSVNGWLTEQTGIGHFAKADYTYPGLYTYMLHNVCVHLQKAGMKKLNVEEDLGIPGLRQAKFLLKPIQMLEKVMICPKAP